jgi:hypothetical protein
MRRTPWNDGSSRFVEILPEETLTPGWRVATRFGGASVSAFSLEFAVQIPNLAQNPAIGCCRRNRRSEAVFSKPTALGRVKHLVDSARRSEQAGYARYAAPDSSFDSGPPET